MRSERKYQYCKVWVRVGEVGRATKKEESEDWKGLLIPGVELVELVELERGVRKTVDFEYLVLFRA